MMARIQRGLSVRPAAVIMSFVLLVAIFSVVPPFAARAADQQPIQLAKPNCGQSGHTTAPEAVVLAGFQHPASRNRSPLQPALGSLGH